jgi:hypothetical protein
MMGTVTYGVSGINEATQQKLCGCTTSLARTTQSSHAVYILDQQSEAKVLHAIRGRECQ